MSDEIRDILLLVGAPLIAALVMTPAALAARSPTGTWLRAFFGTWVIGILVGGLFGLVMDILWTREHGHMPKIPATILLPLMEVVASAIVALLFATLIARFALMLKHKAVSGPGEQEHLHDNAE